MERYQSSTAQAGFTLLELLAVITLLGIVAGAVVASYEGVQDQAREDITRFEMAELRKALLKFRRDSGSRDFPGQGQYSCEDPEYPGSFNAVLDNLPAEAGTTDSEKITWCESPANFWMLFVQPGSGFDWNFDTHRGWNGPYLQRKDRSIDYGTVGNVWGITDSYESPFILVDRADDDKARIVSIGPDRTYDGEGAIPCEPPAGSDDSVLCLLR